MFKTPTELQQFIIWCKKNKVKSFKNDNVQFELSEIAFVPALDPDLEQLEEIKLNDSKTLTDTEELSQEEEEELLYWSSGKLPSRG